MKNISIHNALGKKNDESTQLLCLQHEKLPMSAKGTLEKISFCQR